MKLIQFFLRVLRFIIKVLMLYMLRPVILFLWQGGRKFYERHQSKLTLTYWRRQVALLRQYDWRKAHPRDLLFLWPGTRRVALSLLLCFFVLYLAVYIGLLGGMPTRGNLKAVQNNTASEVYSADGALLGRYYIQDRTNVQYNDISPMAIDALIATEDVRFYEHRGVDVRSSFRVLIKSLLLQEESGGGSTLSQQLAKNLYPRRDYGLFSTPLNKLREIIIAHKLEGVYSKEELLELYLNTVPLGGNLYGIERSARRFFNTTADSLKTEEAAVLIGMLKATTTYNPRLSPERSTQRRNVVLSQMAKYNYLSPAEADSLKALPLRLNYTVTNHNDGLAPYFREQLRLELAAWCRQQEKENGEPYNLYTDGLKIYTTIDAGMQAHAERAVRRKMTQLQERFDAHWKGRAPWGEDAAVVQNAMHRSERYRKMQQAGLSEDAILEAFRKPVTMSVFSWDGSTKKEMAPLDSLRHYARLLNTGLLAMDPQTGYVRAWVGGINHSVFKYDHVRSRRQVGSTFKPFVYAAALEKGIAPCTYFPNERKTYPEYEDWSPQNATGQYGGEYSMRGALAHSVNTISAQLIMETGVGQTVDLAHRLGVESPLPEVPSLALGTADLSLLEMVSAYATFANGGHRVPPVYVARITDRNGKVLRQHRTPVNAERVLSRANAAIMLRLMQGVVEEGSAGRLRSEYGLKMDIAGKTGTTQDHADGWFIGITPKLVTGVWVGAESPKVRFRSLELGQGSRTALPVWGDFMRRIAVDPAFPGYFYSRFEPLPPGLEDQLACDSFRELAPPAEKDGSFLDRLFNKVFGKKKEKKEDRGRGEWKEDDRWKEEEKRREERKKEREKRNKEFEKEYEKREKDREKRQGKTG